MYAYVDVTGKRSVVIVSGVKDIISADRVYKHTSGQDPSKDSNIACYPLNSDFGVFSYENYCKRRKEALKPPTKGK